jgi:hypothetical protein
VTPADTQGVRAHEFAAAIGLIVLAAFVFRWQSGWTAGRATGEAGSPVIPVTTPITSQLCGSDGMNCRDFDVVPLYDGP